MGWITLAARQSELQSSLSQHNYEKLQLQNTLKRLSSFASAIGDGFVDPNEIGSLGFSLFGDALDFNTNAQMSVSEAAQLQTDTYENMYNSVTQEQYYNNPALAAQATLYFDENGNLDTQSMYNNFYDEALKEFAEEYYSTYLKEKEEEIQQEIDELTMLTTSEETELQQVKEKISQEIQNSAIRL